MLAWTSLAFAAAPTSPVLADPVFAEVASGKRPLGPKAKGPAVEALQAVLTLYLYCESTPCRSGVYDEVTEDAVRSWTLEWGIEDADGKLDAPELGFMDSRLNAALYAPIRAAGARGLRYDVPVAAGATADSVRQALGPLAYSKIGSPPDTFPTPAGWTPQAPTAAEIAAGKVEVWLTPEQVRELLGG